MSNANIVLLDRATVESTSSVLRAIADEIDAGKYGPVIAGVVVLHAEEMHMFGSGDANQYKALWMIESVKQHLLA